MIDIGTNYKCSRPL